MWLRCTGKIQLFGALGGSGWEVRAKWSWEVYSVYVFSQQMGWSRQSSPPTGEHHRYFGVRTYRLSCMSGGRTFKVFTIYHGPNSRNGERVIYRDIFHKYEVWGANLLLQFWIRRMFQRSYQAIFIRLWVSGLLEALVKFGEPIGIAAPMSRVTNSAPHI